MDIVTIIFFVIWFTLFFRALYNIFFGKKNKRQTQRQKQKSPSEIPERTGDPDTWEDEEDYSIVVDDTPEKDKTDEEDVAAKFERMLKRNTEAEEARRRAEEEAKSASRVNPKRQDEQRVRQDIDVQSMKDGSDRIRRDGQNQSVKGDANSDRIRHDADSRQIHRDNEPLHDMHGRVHTQNETYAHDKGKTYYDPRGDYSYDEDTMNAETAAFSAMYAQKRLLSQTAANRKNKPRLKLKQSSLVQGLLMSQVLGKPRALKPYAEDELL